jgi:hypothetical protein
MKSILVAVFMGAVVLLMVCSCATVPTEPLGSDELRLLSIKIPGSGRIKTGALYTINVRYESGGQPKIEKMCYFMSNRGPYCSKATDLALGLAGEFQMEIGGSDIGPQRLEIYVDYYGERKLRRTNRLSSLLEVTK